MKNTTDDLAILGSPPAFREKLHVGRPSIGDRLRLLERINHILDRRWLTNSGLFVREYEARVAVLDNFLQLHLVKEGRRNVFRSWFNQDKGHYGEWEVFVRNISSGCQSAISFDEIICTSLSTLAAAKSLKDGSQTVISSASLTNEVDNHDS